MTPPRPRLRARLALSAASVAATLLLAEGLLRLLGIGSPGRGSRWFAGGNHPRFLFAADAECGYGLSPGFRGREVSTFGEFEVPVAIDGRGLRDHPHRAAEASSILALGDSMTFGEGVTEGEAYPAILEAASGVRVVNGGVPGYGTPQMICRMRRLLPHLRPTLVFVTFSATWDLGRCGHPFLYHEGFIVAPNYRDRLYLIGGNLYPAEVRWPLVGPATAYAEGWSNLGRLALPAFRRWATALAGATRGRPSRQAHEPCLSTLEAGRTEAERAGARLVAVLVDSPEPESREDTAAVGRWLDEHGIAHLLLDDLLAGEDLERLRFRADRHWNAEGHRRVGEALAGALPQLAPGEIGPALPAATGSLR
jgi:hypothetical protein